MVTDSEPEPPPPKEEKAAEGAVEGDGATESQPAVPIVVASAESSVSLSQRGARA